MTYVYILKETAQKKQAEEAQENCNSIGYCGRTEMCGQFGMGVLCTWRRTRLIPPQLIRFKIIIPTDKFYIKRYL